MKFVEHYQGMRYVRITFIPAGSKKKRTEWALEIKPGMYKVADKDGGGIKRKLTKAAVQEEIIVAVGHEVEIIPARLNLHYGQLEISK